MLPGVSVTASSTALLVIDVQREALAGCADAREVVERINDLSQRAQEAGAAVIFIQHEGDDELIKGSPGWQLAEGLELREGALLVHKTYRDGFAATDLEALLARLGVRRLVVTGAHSDFCVQTTALSALVHGFDVVLVSDAHTTVPSSEDPARSGKALTTLVNTRFATLRHPERTIEVLPAAQVVL
jgi:nicotinamidase-related amidase